MTAKGCPFSRTVKELLLAGSMNMIRIILAVIIEPTARLDRIRLPGASGLFSPAIHGWRLIGETYENTSGGRRFPAR
jgi:hypothetical protein